MSQHGVLRHHAFLTGGIPEAHRSGRKLTTREFFEGLRQLFLAMGAAVHSLMAIVLIPPLSRHVVGDQSGENDA